MAEWIIAATAVMGILVTVASALQKWGHGEAKSDSRIKAVEDALNRHEAHHARHFQAEQAMATGIASVNQRVSDHERHDEERFERIEEMHREIRDDIKELLKRK